MKDKEKKNKKYHESTIGKIIYGFLLFLPLLAIGVTCSYAIFNKNAYHSYYAENINESELVEIQEIKSNETYYLKPNNSVSNFTSNITFTCEDTSYIIVQNNKTYYDNGFFYYNEGQAKNYIALRLGNDTYSYTALSSFVEGKINNFYSTSPNLNYLIGYLYQYEYNNNSFISEVFYYSVDKVTQSNLFNWTQNTTIYTTINQFTNTLGITNIFMPILLTYWLIISIVYFLYDIVLMILVVLHRKIHELQDTI